jgi:hypothetical protein
VCGSGQSKLVQINEKTDVKLGALGNVSKSFPTSFDLKHNRLVVTNLSSNMIEVYDIFLVYHTEIKLVTSN